MRSANVGYTVREARSSDRPQVLDLLRRSLAGGPTGERSEGFFRWKHELNPFGPSFSLVAEEDGRLIGFRTFLRWRFRAGERTVAAVRAVDTATHPDHQRRGIFTRLTLSALDALDGRADLVFNTPNERSLPGYLKMGWQRVGTVPVAIRPVRPIRFARGIRQAGRGAPSGPPPSCPLPSASETLDDTSAVEQLLSEATPTHARLTTDRSLEYLRWRYVLPPDLDYRGVALWSGSRLDGLALGRPRRRGRLAEFVLGEVLVRPGDTSSARRLLRAVTRAGSDHIAAHLDGGGTLRRAGLATGYLSLPRVGMTLTCRPLTEITLDPMQLGSWDLSLGDLEVF